jgi:hypothetical protein
MRAADAGGASQQASHHRGRPALTRMAARFGHIVRDESDRRARRGPKYSRSWNVSLARFHGVGSDEHKRREVPVQFHNLDLLQTALNRCPIKQASPKGAKKVQQEAFPAASDKGAD